MILQPCRLANLPTLSVTIGEIAMTKNMTPIDFPPFGTKTMTLQRRAMEMAQTNMQLTFNFVSALLACRTPNDLMKVTQNYTEQQMAEFQKQAKELTDLAPNKDAVA